MSRPNPNYNKLTRLEAKIAVMAIKRSVSTTLNDSRLMQGTTTSERHERFGLFRKEELILGKLLGKGGFNDVYEIERFTPSSDRCDEEFGAQQEAIRKIYSGDEVTPGKCVMKRLRARSTADPSRFCAAASDLVIESQFLCRLNHKNIIKIRGWSSGGIRAYSDGNHDGFFLVLDRVSTTLQDRIKTWREERDQLFAASSCPASTLKTHQIARIHQLKRATSIASQIADALEYLHAKGIVFRDLKPANVGFDACGTIKLFDFGLARELPTDHSTKEVYEMSGTVGTQRFMAPEVALSKMYNQKVDTYSWSMLYWSCLTLEKPYGNMNKATHRSLVCKLGCRPYVAEDFPISMEKVLTQAWLHNVTSRLTMSQVCQKMKIVAADLDCEAIAECVDSSNDSTHEGNIMNVKSLNQ